ncbi:NACHT C-terminal helical domain 2-containing protein [Pseudanabaena sp. UWO310]|uniref:NACHT C-terminal helical domain 2-containing protein n=1 Tax=Pseudanabaena sp. UWO310 TaxID=2480795 RepID=UPI00115903F7|nr:NACHT domain-containing protein [Pseudanabaena sp. UWO310]TYQ26566.1 NACHT domain-containing NTPase [Pseudanabaena sp. UWO310]
MSRSLRASEAGIKQIKSAMKQGGFTQEALAKALGISRSVITVLFRGEGIDRANFEELCKFLELDWRDIRGEETGKPLMMTEAKEEEVTVKQVGADRLTAGGDITVTINQIVGNSDKSPEAKDMPKVSIEDLVKLVRERCADDIRERCGTMRVLDMTQPVDLDRIYTDVNIIKDVIGRRRIGYDEVMEVCTREHFDRFLVGTIKERVTGFAAVEEFQKLVVLGKPGAGKTTFMKYLAMSCLGGRFHGELVPIFVTLKAYAEERGQPSLENYILTEFAKRKVSQDVAKQLLDNGRALILLDGLDEVKKEDDRRVKQDIDRFSRDWLKNRFAITCRIAAREYQFEKFTEVEVADFDDGQIETFVNNWFRERDAAKAERMLERLKGNKPVKELAKSPLLLTLLCLVFGERNDFPPKRSELYKEGLEVLMKKWDAKRNIEREIIYKHLSPQNKEDMLGQIAFNTFVNGEYFFRQEDLQRQIKDYICNLPETSADPEALRLDSEAVLKAIEHHHGLLVERARNIYSFSHLTFQEYFAAREIERERHFERLIENISNPRWKEVFYLTAEMLRRSDSFLLLMKDHIDEIFNKNDDLQRFLLWLNRKVYVSSKKYKMVALRAYFAYIAFSLSILKSSVLLTLDSEHSKTLAQSLIFNKAFDKSDTISIACGVDSNFSCDISNNFNLDVNCKTIQESLQIVQMIRNGFINLKIEGQEFFQWFESNGEDWSQSFHQVCLDSLNKSFGFDWQFFPSQLEVFTQYYAANLLLVECMNRSYVSKQVREEIESTMLLPSKK